MKVSVLRKILADSKYDDISLSVSVNPEDVNLGCYMCVFNTEKHRCMFNGMSTIRDSGEYHDYCQYIKFGD